MINNKEYGNNRTEVSLNTLYWLIFLALIIPFLTTIFIFISGLGEIFLYDITTIEDLEFSTDFNSIVTILSVLFVAPFIKYSLSAKNHLDCVKLLALQPIAIAPLIGTLVAALSYLIFESLLFRLGWVNLPMYMVNIANQVNSTSQIVMLFISACLIAPFIEEILFRGIAYHRLQTSSFGASSSIILPSIIFTLIHFQYEQLLIFVLLFTSSCLLGVIRHVTGNLWYCIIGHMAMNIYALSNGFL